VPSNYGRYIVLAVETIIMKHLLHNHSSSHSIETLVYAIETLVHGIEMRGNVYVCVRDEV